ncbi:lysozyme family protein [Nonlabens xiamenensis]|uniref:peptidoglycan-binding protein LysM n=1 Tax=Nonlabens xiamenensis TaxID=2341043 RepID=UPI000F612331|nr:peptidoglycan-binding protein LysM [Nonlabens xiamenensis]
MRSHLVSFLAYPAVFVLSLSALKWKTNTNHSIVPSRHDVAIETNTISLPMGPFLEEKPLDFRDYSLATSSRDSFISFKEALAYKESRGQWWQVNTLGYLGKYQFGPVTLQHFGVNDTTAFLRSLRLQERIFIKNLKYNHKVLQPYIEKYEGSNVGGIHITESGLLAAAHLSGPGGVKRFLNSNGSKASRDAYGSSIKTYMKRFGGYDLSEVID